MDPIEHKNSIDLHGNVNQVEQAIDEQIFANLHLDLQLRLRPLVFINRRFQSIPSEVFANLTAEEFQSMLPTAPQNINRVGFWRLIAQQMDFFGG